MYWHFCRLVLDNKSEVPTCSAKRKKLSVEPSAQRERIKAIEEVSLGTATIPSLHLPLLTILLPTLNHTHAHVHTHLTFKRHFTELPLYNISNSLHILMTLYLLFQFIPKCNNRITFKFEIVSFKKGN